MTNGDPQQKPVVKSRPVLDPESTMSINLFVDSTKQIITLSTSIIAVVVAFATSFIARLEGILLILAFFSLTSLLLSSVLGFLTINAITGMIDPQSPGTQEMLNDGTREATISVYDQPTRRLSLFQWGFFGFGLGLIVLVLIVFAAIPEPLPNMDLAVKQTLQSIEIQATINSYATALYAPPKALSVATPTESLISSQTTFPMSKSSGTPTLVMNPFRMSISTP